MNVLFGSENTRSWKPSNDGETVTNHTMKEEENSKDHIQVRIEKKEVSNSLLNMTDMPKNRTIKPAMSNIEIAEKSCLEELRAQYNIGIAIQEQKNAYTNADEGGEVLLTLTDKEGKKVNTEEFISKLEKDKDPLKIQAVSLYVMENVCKRLSELIRKGGLPSELSISVNVSRAQMSNFTMANQYINIAKRYNIPPGLIQLEVTETSHSDEYKMNLLMGVLQAGGFNIAIDDYGKGYNNDLTLFRGIPDTIKLDRETVRDIMDIVINGNENRKPDDIVRAFKIYDEVLDHTRHFGHKIVLEGVEMEDLEAIKSAIRGDLSNELNELELMERHQTAKLAKNLMEFEMVKQKIVHVYTRYLKSRLFHDLDYLEELVDRHRTLTIMIRRGKDSARNLIVQSYSANYDQKPYDFDQWPLPDFHSIGI